MDSVNNVTEVTGTSSESWEQAARAAVFEASEQAGGAVVADLLRQRVVVDDDGGLSFHVTLAVHAEIDLRSGVFEAPGTKRYLIVANQTLASSGLEQLVHELVAAGPCHFHVVVPQVGTSTVHVDPAGLLDPTLQTTLNEAYLTARREAENRLQTFRQLFAETHEGELTGEVVVGDPLQAVRQMMARTAFDEIIVSTLPPGISKWLHMDLPHRIDRAFDVPVTSLVQEIQVVSV